MMMTEDENMLSLVLSDALQGVDIIKQYPDFYRKMLADAELRQLFLDALELLEQEQAGELIPLPPDTPVDLSFLKTAVFPRPAIEYTAPGQWRVAWRLLREQLTRIFQPPELAYRAGGAALEEESEILMRSQFDLGNTPLDVLLEAARPVDEPDRLHLFLLAASPADAPLPPITARLQWGDVRQAAVTDRYGRARFQPIPLAALLDADRQTIAADLQLTLEPGKNL